MTHLVWIPQNGLALTFPWSFKINRFLVKKPYHERVQFKNKEPHSNFLSTVISNFEYAFFFGIYWHFIICVFHWISATKESLSWSQKRSNPFSVTNKWFIRCIDSVRQTSSKNWQKKCRNRRHGQNWKLYQGNYIGVP